MIPRNARSIYQSAFGAVGDKPETPELETYKAYGVAARPRDAWMLDLRRANGVERSGIPYTRIAAVDLKSDMRLAIMCDGFTVNIEGANLMDVYERFHTSEVAWLQEHNPERWAAPDEGAPLIRRITLEPMRYQERER